MKKILLLLLSLALHELQAQTFEAHAPKTFAEILAQNYNISWTPAGISAIENLKHFVLLDASTKGNALMLDAASGSSLSFKTTDNLSSSTATYGSLLQGMFQLVDINSNTDNALSGQYRIHPLLDSYFALNADGTSLVSSDAGSFYVDATGGYLVFELGGTPTSTTVKAVAQYTYNTTSNAFENNASWTIQWLKISGESVVLTSLEGEASSFYLANAFDLIDFSLELGSDFNPGSTEWQDNAFAAYPEEVWDYNESALFGDQFTKDVDVSYQTQFGNSTEASAAAVTALDEIETTLTNDGESLRYDKSVYLTFRENLLARTFGANDIYNSKFGESTVEYVYFTNATDQEGVHHPFMVIASHNASDGPNFLIDVSRPPGASDNGGYEEQSITRNAILEVKLVKIPLKDYGLVENLTDNDLTPYGSLASDLNLDASFYDVYNYAGTASNGIAIDGVVIYPAYNNNLRVAAADAEITSTGIHVGRGMGLHYHADGHGYNGNGINLYNLSDYSGKSHPPIIGFAYDGIALFGKYESDFNSMEGYSIALDEFGGHDHSSFGYHYHAFGGDMTYQDEMGSTVGPFTQHHLLVGAWKGNINDIPGFNQGSAAQLKDATYGRFAGAPYDPSAITNITSDFDENLQEISVFPNPSSRAFTVIAPGIESLELIDMNGRVIQSKEIDPLVGIAAFDQVGKGIFVIKGEGFNKSFTRRILIK